MNHSSFRTVDIIRKKRDGKVLTNPEIHYLMKEYTKDRIPDYQMSAWAMAVYFQGMTVEETASLTQAMTASGEQMDLSSIKGIKVDKHSTGGVGDKTSLIVAPLVANVGVPVAKMSGRGLGHTGGTIDKLESIPGFTAERSKEQFIKQVNQCKLAIISQSGNITPADKKLYALRDVTATVESIPLLASSIMSKKLASGADSIVLDVKTGDGAFMKSLDDARELAQAMVNIGNQLQRKTIAIISDMSQPLGLEIGNANEVREAIEVLQGEGARDLTEVCLTLASHMCVQGGMFKNVDQAYTDLEHMLYSGTALEALKAFVQAQGGDIDVIDNPEKLPRAKYQVEIMAEEDGYVHKIDAEQVGMAAMLLGAGRQKKDDPIDHSVGITLKKKVGHPVFRGEPLAVLHSNQQDNHTSEQMIRKSVSIQTHKGRDIPLIYDIIE